MRRFVFCDLDMTLVRKNTSFGFGVFLSKKGLLNWTKALALTFHYALFSLGIISLRTLHQKSFDHLFKGQSKEVFSKLAEEFTCHFLMKEKIEAVEAFLQKKKEEGYSLHLLSTSPDFLVEIFGRRSGFISCHGTEYLAGPEGIFSEVGGIMDGERKAEIAKELAGNGPSAETIALSDSIHDLKFLSSVNTPIAVNPCPALRKEALKLGWQILEHS